MKSTPAIRNLSFAFIAFVSSVLSAQISSTRHNIDTSFQEGYWLQAVDFDSDGDADIVASSLSSGLKWYRNDGSGVFTGVTVDNAFNDAWSVHAADLDNDGDLDVVAVSMNEDTQVSKLTWFELKGTGNFSDHAISTQSNLLPQSVFAADLDNDGDNDILMAAWGIGAMKWWENTPGDVFVEHTLDSTINSAHTIAAADLNGDGLMDVFGAGGGKTNIWRNDGNLDFTRKTLGSGGGFGVFAEDLNGDGLLDVIRTERNGDLDWFRNKGSSSFTAENIIAANIGESWSMAMGDFDADGDNDLVAAGYVFTPNKISLFINDGSNSFSEQVLDDTFSRPRCVAVADFDGDGDDDIAAVVTKANSIYWYEVDTQASVKTITITAPNGGESLAYGDTSGVQWSQTGSIANVRIEYSTDNGSIWTELTASVANTGNYSWQVPNVQTSLGLVRVTDVADSTVADTSDAVFSITGKGVTLTKPNGGEIWVVESEEEITWSSYGDIVNVALEYSTDGGVNWTAISSSVVNSGSYTWTVPEDTSSDGLVRISDASDSALFDVSDQSFTITKSALTITSPNGGEQWQAGTFQLITWNTTGVVPIVKTEYSADGGTNWQTIVAQTANTGSSSWLVPDNVTQQALVRVTNTAGSLPFDISDAWFSILPEAALTLTSPNGGENLQSGSAHAITWTGPASIFSIIIEFSPDGGDSWQTIANDAANDGSYDWLVPVGETTNAYIRISDAADGTPSDMSDAGFSILPAAAVSVISPNGGEQWLAGDAHDIIWNSSGTVGVLKIDYSLDAGTTWFNLVSETENNGTYAWTVPNVSSEQALVRITDSNNSAVSDVSDTLFTIVTAGLTVVQPNGGDTLYAGSTFDVTWSSTGSVSDIKIEMSINGAAWELITAATPNDGSYLWEVPALNFTQVLLKISEADDGTPADVSDAVFTITTDPVDVRHDPTEQLPTDFVLQQNFPNPFNLGTKINFSVPRTLPVTLNLFNLQGEIITTLFSGELVRGSYSAFWDGKDAAGKVMTSGLYVYSIRIGTWQAARKLMLVK